MVNRSIFNLPDKLDKKIKKYSQDNLISKSDTIRMILKKYFENENRK